MLTIKSEMQLNHYRSLNKLKQIILPKLAIRLQENADRKISLNLPSDYCIQHMEGLIDPGEMSNTMLHAENIAELKSNFFDASF